MKAVKSILGGLCLCAAISSCAPSAQKEVGAEAQAPSKSEVVIENIMTRRSIRQYKPQAVNRDTMQVILNCGINAPNGQNKQSWEIRVVDNPEYINGLTEVYKKANPKVAEDPSFKNMFRNAPTVVFIARDTKYDMSQIDCGLLGGNMVLSAWSMGIGSCCLGGPVRFMLTDKEAAPYRTRRRLPTWRSWASAKVMNCSIASPSVIRTRRLPPSPAMRRRCASSINVLVSA